MNNYSIVKNYNDYSFLEKSFLSKWVKNDDNFCEIVRESYLDNNPNKKLEKMFSQYDSDYSKNIYIYRGLNFQKNNQLEIDTYQELCVYFKDAYNNKDKVYIDYAPSSFSFSSLILLGIIPRPLGRFISPLGDNLS